MSQVSATTGVPTAATRQGAADPLARARAQAHDRLERLQVTTTRLRQLRDGIRAEVSNLHQARVIGAHEANDILRRLRVPRLRHPFYCQVDLSITIDVDVVGDAAALRQAQQILTAGLTSLDQIEIRREPDSFGIDAPHTADDGQPHRLVHTTMPLIVAVTTVNEFSAWPAAKRRLGNQFRRVPALHADIGAIYQIVVYDENHDPLEWIYPLRDA